MIPLRDNIPSRRFPLMNLALIVATVLAFLYEVSLPLAERQELIVRLGLVPARVLSPAPGEGGLLDLVIPVFLHGGWIHILGNMLFLWVFGDNVEDLMGPGRYLVFYLLAGVAGNLAHVLANPGSTVPTIGASGAVAGVLGAYLLHYPRARIVALVPLGIFLTTAEVPAIFFLALWFLLQLANGLASLGVNALNATGGVAWWAHVGGFVGGALLSVILRQGRYVR